jgi:hypothetical protein
MAATLCLASRSYEGRRRRDTTAGASLGFANLEKRRVVSAPAVIADRPEFRFGMNSGARGRRRCSPKALADRLICAGEQAQQRGAFVGERAPGRLAAWLPEWTMRGTASRRRSLSLATFAEVPRDTADLRGIDLTHVCDPYTGTTPESTVPAASPRDDDQRSRRTSPDRRVRRWIRQSSPGRRGPSGWTSESSWASGNLDPALDSAGRRPRAGAQELAAARSLA